MVLYFDKYRWRLLRMDTFGNNIVYAIIYVLINDKKVEDDDEDITNKE